MTSKWNTAGEPRPTGSTTFPVKTDQHTEGIDTAATHYAGSSDPSVGAPSAWGAAEIGTFWLDTTDPQNPKLKQWQQLTATPTYGWRPLCLRYFDVRGDPQAITFSPAGPYTVNQAFTDLDLSALLDNIQTVSAGLVSEVLLKVRIADTGTGFATTQPYVAFRQNGILTAASERRLYAQVSGLAVERDIWIPLDVNEIVEWAVTVAPTSPSFTLEAWLVGFAETL